MKHALLLIAACAASPILAGCHATAETMRAPTHHGPTDGGTGVASDDAASLGINAPRIFLGDVPIEKRSAGPLDGTGPFRILIRAALGSSAMHELSRRGVRYAKHGDEGELQFRGYPQARDRPTAGDRASSFIIDFDSTEVSRAREEAQRELGAHPKMVDLAQFVNRYIVTKDLLRPYDPASVVAERREGDCSEHAVLLAALGRSFGFATRVVHGIVILEAPGRIEAEGHAWVEWADRSGWLPADAALPAALHPIYVPLQLLKDESPAYGRHLLLSMPLQLGPIAIEAQ